MNHFVFRVFGIVLVVVINSEIGSSVAYGGACFGGGSCDDADTECVSNACACVTTHFRNNADDACLAKVELAASCEAIQPTDQCLDTNAECDGTSLQCRCKANYYVNKNNVCNPVVATLDGACDATDSASGQCAKTDTSCTLDGASAKCQCIANTHYSDGADCQTKKEPSVACLATYQCVTNAECDTTDTQLCVCNAGYTATPTAAPIMCSLNNVVKFPNLPYMYLLPIILSMLSLLR